MCGINGFLSKNGLNSVDEKLKKMNQKIIHRGPDEDGFFFESNENVTVVSRSTFKKINRQPAKRLSCEELEDLKV